MSIASTENNSINGYVIDSNTGEALAGVMITTLNDTTYSDLDGHFNLKKSSDSTNIKFQLISYEIIDTIIYNNKLVISELNAD